MIRKISHELILNITKGMKAEKTNLPVETKTAVHIQFGSCKSVLINIMSVLHQYCGLS